MDSKNVSQTCHSGFFDTCITVILSATSIVWIVVDIKLFWLVWKIIHFKRNNSPALLHYFCLASMYMYSFRSTFEIERKWKRELLLIGLPLFGQITARVDVKGKLFTVISHFHFVVRKWGIHMHGWHWKYSIT